MNIEERDTQKQSWTEHEIKELFFEQLQSLVDEFGEDVVLAKMHSGEGFSLTRESFGGTE